MACGEVEEPLCVLAEDHGGVHGEGHDEELGEGHCVEPGVELGDGLDGAGLELSSLEQPSEAEERLLQQGQVHVSEELHGVLHDVLHAQLHGGLHDVPRDVLHGVHDDPLHPPDCSLLEWSLETQPQLAS